MTADLRLAAGLPSHTPAVWSTSDPVSRLGLSVAIILIAAKVGGDLAARAKQPSVLGELVAGILLGSLPLSFFHELRTDAGVDMLARLGVLVLLFEVGLDSTVRDVVRVGIPSMRVAILGTVGTLLFGWVACRLVAPGSGTLVQLFMAAAITATSVGISARVLKDAGASHQPEAHTILGAAVLDDVLGLVVLAIVSSAIDRRGVGGVNPWSMALLIAKTVAFLAVALVAGTRLSPAVFRFSAGLRGGGACRGGPGALLRVGLVGGRDGARADGGCLRGRAGPRGFALRPIRRARRAVAARAHGAESRLGSSPIFFVLFWGCEPTSARSTTARRCCWS